jgi:hypothetical protein
MTTNADLKARHAIPLGDRLASHDIPKTVVKEGSIGPASDPYSTVTITTTKGDRKATRYWDGLGSNYLELKTGELVVRREDWIDSGPVRKERIATLADSRYQQHVGVNPMSAYIDYQNEESPDNDAFFG